MEITFLQDVASRSLVNAYWRRRGLCEDIICPCFIIRTQEKIRINVRDSTEDRNITLLQNSSTHLLDMIQRNTQ
jgi:hypothetical protein